MRQADFNTVSQDNWRLYFLDIGHERVPAAAVSLKGHSRFNVTVGLLTYWLSVGIS